MTVRRKVGMPQPSRTQCRSAIERVPQWRGGGQPIPRLVADDEPETGWSTFRRIRADISSRCRRRSEMFIDRVAATGRAQRPRHGALAPEVIFFDAQDGLEVSRNSRVRACTNGDFGDSTIQSDVSALSRLHAGPKLSLTKTIFDMIEEHVEQGRELARTFHMKMSWIMHRYGRRKAAFTASGLDLVPRFNDPMAREFPHCPQSRAQPEADAADRLRVRLQQRAELELGVLFAEMFFDEQMTEGLIEQYRGRCSEMVARSS